MGNMHVTGCSVPDFWRIKAFAFSGPFVTLIDRYRILILRLEAYSNKKGRSVRRGSTHGCGNFSPNFGG